MVKFGEIYETNNCGDVKVILYDSCTKVIVQFSDGTEVVVQAGALRNGKVKNPNCPNICGKGFIGIGKYSSKTHPKLHQKFNDMFKRCYGSKLVNTTYNDCRVSKRWRNFQKFCKDIEKMVGYGIEGMDIDKDILVPGNRLYSRKRCVLVSHVINCLVQKSPKPSDLPLGVCVIKEEKHLPKPYRAQCNIGVKTIYLGNYKTPEEAFVVYKKFKEKRIKKVTRKYKNIIDRRTYKALINYKVKPF